jgi:hypothetical protein
MSGGRRRRRYMYMGGMGNIFIFHDYKNGDNL